MKKRVCDMKYGMSSMDVKRLNRNRVFRFLNSTDKCSMPEIASALDMSSPTVLQIIKELRKEGFIQDVGELKSTGGRKAKAIATIKNKKYAIGLDVTKNHVSVVLTDLSEVALNHIRIRKPFQNNEQYYKEVAELLREYIDSDAEVREKLLGIGISVPAIVNGEENTIENSRALNLPKMSLDGFSQYTQYPITIINDANAAAIAECTVSKRRRNMVYLSLSNTVGGAISLGNGVEKNSTQGQISGTYENLYIGNHWCSGEFGHMVIQPEGQKCYCGKQGCLDAYCSALRLTECTEGNLELFFQKLEEKDPKIVQVFESYLKSLAIAVDNLRMCFDCEIILGGYVGSYMEPYIERLQMKLKDKAIFANQDRYVMACKYRLEASALGAGIYYIDQYINSI